MSAGGDCVGILGGSFNPVHNGHLAVARAMLAEGAAGEVRLMVSPQNPMKSAAGLLDENVRYRLVRLACEGEDRILPSDFEFSLPRPSYTWRTLEALREAEPGRAFKLLMGADSWQAFRSWRRAGSILRSFPVAVYPRRGCRLCAEALPAGVECVDAPMLDISSTGIRRMIREGEDVSALLPPEVLREIVALGLYA